MLTSKGAFNNVAEDDENTPLHIRLILPMHVQMYSYKYKLIIKNNKDQQRII